MMPIARIEHARRQPASPLSPAPGACRRGDHVREGVVPTGRRSSSLGRQPDPSGPGDHTHARGRRIIGVRDRYSPQLLSDRRGASPRSG